MPSVKLLNLIVDERGVTELAGKQRIAFVPRDGIERIELAEGFLSERPMLQLVAGGALIALGIAAGIPLLRKLLSTSPEFYSGWQGTLTVFPLMLGVLAVGATLRRGLYLRVTTRSGIRKLVVRGTSAPHELERLLAEARVQLGI
jgi:hypothetical protein